MMVRELTKFFLLFLSILMLNAGNFSMATNLLTNGGFESDAAKPWNTYGDAKISLVKSLDGAAKKEGPVEGKQALLVQVSKKGGNFWDSGLQHKGHVFEKGKKYTLAAFFKTKKGELQVNFKPELAKDPYTKIAGKKFTVNETWQEFHVTSVELAAAVDPAQITFHIGFDVAEFWVDGVRFFEGDYVDPPKAATTAVKAKGKLATIWGNIKKKQ